MDIDGWVCIAIFVVEGIAIGWIAYRAGYESRERYIDALLSIMDDLADELGVNDAETRELIDGLED